MRAIIVTLFIGIGIGYIGRGYTLPIGQLDNSIVETKVRNIASTPKSFDSREEEIAHEIFNSENRSAKKLPLEDQPKEIQEIDRSLISDVKQYSNSEVAHLLFIDVDAQDEYNENQAGDYNALEANAEEELLNQ